MNKYILVVADHQNDLVKKVNKEIASGYDVQGGVSLTSFIDKCSNTVKRNFCQAMIMHNVKLVQ